MQLNNRKATELIKNLLKNNKDNDNANIHKAFEVYNQIDGIKNHRVVNALLQLCSRLKQSHKVLSIWNDIENVKNGINYQLLFKCCVNHSDQNLMVKSITVLQWMRYSNYKLQKYQIKDHSINIVKLIAKNKNNIKMIKQIHSLIDMKEIYDDIFIKTALINAYGECMDIIAAKNVFRTIGIDNQDSITIGVMMKALIRNQCNKEVLLLYQQYSSFNNDVTHMHALQACINNKDYRKGTEIIQKYIKPNNEAIISDQLQNTMINFYGNFGDISNAFKLFNNIKNNEKNKIVNINVMLKSYVNNGYNKEALSLYDCNKDVVNEISHTLALKACINLKDFEKCKQIHQSIQSKNIYSIELSSTLIDFYGQIGDIDTAIKIFESIKMDKHTVVSIGCMMKILNQNHRNNKAIALYEKFDKLQNDISHLYAIKACIDANDFEKGKEIHQSIINQGGINNIKLLNSLIDFYGYFEDITNASMLFHSVPDDKKDFVSIGSMMNAYIINNLNEEVIAIYNQYKSLIDDTSFALVIKACINSDNFEKGKQIYDDIIKHMENMNISLRNTLIDFFGTFQDLSTALDVFDNIPSNEMDAVSIGTMIKTYINNEYSEKALLLYDKYPLLHDDISHTLTIKACKNINNFERGKQIHNDISENMRLNDPDIQYFNTLIDFYCHFGDISIAKDILDEIPKQKINPQTINIIIKACIDNNDNEKALAMYDKFQSLNNDISHLYALKACINTDDFKKGQMIHKCISQNNDFDNIILKNMLIEFYGHFNDTNNALIIFDSINDSQKSTATINSMIKCLISSDKALILYEQYYGLTDDISHTLALKVCKLTNNQQYGEYIYQTIQDKTSNIQLQNTLIDFFGHFGNINAAINIFENVEQKNCATVNSMISALIDNQRYMDAISVYNKYETLQDNISHLLIIKTCTNCGDFEKGKQVHNKLEGCIEMIALQNTLIDFYGNFDDIQSALKIFNLIPNEKKDIYTIGAMMNAYCNCKMETQCIQLFENINRINNKLQPNVVCYSNLFKACTQGTSYHFGKQMHDKLSNDKINAWMLCETEIQITLINMYGKCGMLHICDEIFDKSNKEIGIWNAIIYAYGRNGDIIKAKQLFDTMRNESKLRGDYRTFIVLINACSHSGYIDEAKDIWENQINDDVIKYNKNVITSIIDCYSRKGYLDRGYDVIKEYYVQNLNKYNDEDVTMLMALLSGCKKYENQELAQIIYDEIERHFEKNESYMTSAFSILSNIYINNSCPSSTTLI